MQSFSSNMLMLFDFLNYQISRKIKYEKIVLIGDIVEDWYIDSDDAFDKYPEILMLFFYKLKLLSDRIIFVKGNHDSDSLWGKLPRSTERFLIGMKVEIFNRQFTEEKLFYAHGDKGEGAFPLFVFINILAAKFTFSTLKWIAMCFGTKGKTLYTRLKPYYDKLTNSDYLCDTIEAQEIYYSKVRARLNVPEDFTLVCGHTHNPLILESMKVINDGDWMHHTSFVEIDHNSNIAFLCKYTRDGLIIDNQMEF